MTPPGQPDPRGAFIEAAIWRGTLDAAGSILGYDEVDDLLTARNAWRPRPGRVPNSFKIAEFPSPGWRDNG